ncbi:hypothetical protein NQ317_000946 [Molorchus minor]|uniref:Ig-like domain-containing protein n=1 Tax=Molorchus minor TaxID=1323400 RepID=A0ABQ9JSZ2_9CUCU|nr:hypothetical protein NQ317_000946 [Molorchus minor]
MAEEEKRRAEKARIEEELRVSEEKRKAAKAAPQNLEKQGLLEITEITEVHKVESQGVRKQIPSPIPIIEEASEIPVFTTPLSDAVIQEGSKFTFICQVTGHPKPLVTWYKAGISIQNNPDYHTAYENGLCSLTIEETFAEDSARYTCRAANAAGEAETTALLSVKETEPEEQVIAPSFSKLLQPGVAKEGTPFQFVCKVEGNPLPTVQWYKNSDCIDNSPDYIITYNNGEAILKFENVFLEDKAEYTCKAANELGTAQSTANLVVTPLEPTEAPAFVVPLSNVMARAGQKIKLECEVSGLPLPTLTWSHNGKPVKETRELKLQCEDKKATLIIYEAFPKDAGTYQVSAKNIAGEANSSCSVSVKGRLPTETSDSEMASDMEPVKPSIQLPLADTAVKEGNRIRLDCVIVGQPEPEVIWYHDDRPVKESPDFQLLFQGDRCSLVIQEALPEDAGEYKVVALNSAGEASSKCILSVTLAAESDAESKPPEEKKEPVSTAPKFTKLLTDILMSEGEKVILEGNVVGSHDLSHDEEGNVRLEIVSVRPEDKGVYTVKATNSAGEAKCFAQLIVKGGKPLETIIHEEVKLAPEFKEVFHDRTAFEDTPTKFECIATGKPKPKIKWLFNGNAISGMDFLISTSGDRQVLAISVLKKEHNGTITCVAENEVGKASCAATLSVQPPSSISLPEIPLQPPLQVPQQVSVFSSLTPMHTEKSQHIETSYKNTREVVTQSSTSKSSKITSSTSGITEPHVEEHKVIAEDSQTFKQINQEAPVIKESHRLEEYHKVGKEPPVFSGEIFSELFHWTNEPPRFVTPVTGRIIDQNVDVLLEGILDGQPSPNISWTKNGEELKATERVKIKWEQNRASVEIKNANIEDAGRYSCTAVNEGGTAVSTADLVVRKTIFPPVFGRRLQAQVVKKGERIIMEVEVTGTPEPTVTWYRDGVPVQESLKDNYKIKSMGQSHTLVIDKADLAQSGRFMVRAVNAGGEAQSIADIAVYEPTPDTMLEVVKTVVFEDVRKHETLTSAADRVSSTITTPKPVPVVPPKIETPSSIFSSTQTSQSISSKSETMSSTEQNVSQQYQTFKLEHEVPDIPMPKPIETIRDERIQRQTDFEICMPGESIQKEVIEEKSQKSRRLKIKEGDTAAPKEPINQEYKTYSQEVTKEYTSQPQRQEYKSFSSTQQVVQPQEYNSFSSSQQVTQEFQLKPEPPAQICYPKKEIFNERIIQTKTETSQPTPIIPQQPTSVWAPSKPTEHVSEKQESFEKSLQQSSYQTSSSSYIASSSYSTSERQFYSRPVSAQSVTTEPSHEALQMEKQWAHKFSEIHTEKSWPPPQSEEPQIKPSCHKRVETPTQHYIAEVSNLGSVVDQQHLSESSISKSEVIIEESKKPSEITRSWPPVQEPRPFTSIDTLSIRPVSVQDITDEVILEPGPPPEIAYAEPPKERRRSYVEVIEQELEKNLKPAKVPPCAVVPQAPPIPAKSVKHVTPPKKSKEIKFTPFEKFPDLEPFPFTAEPQRPRLPKAGPPPTPSKFIRGRFTDSDYESDFESVRIPPKWKPSMSDTEEPTYRRVKAPQLVHTGPPRPEINFEEFIRSQKGATPVKKFTKHVRAQETKREISPPKIKPASPPIYVQPAKRPESPKSKHKVVIDGYMADTDEPFRQQKMFTESYSKEERSEYRHISKSSEKIVESSSQKFVTPKPRVSKFPVKKHHASSVSSSKKELIDTPIITSSTSKEVYESQEKHVQLEPFPFKAEPPKSAILKGPPPPTPSKFTKGGFHESDYESDYEGRIPPIWGSDTDLNSISNMEGHPTPPTEFDNPPQIGTPRPKFEPIEKFKPQVRPAPKPVYKPKPISAAPVTDVIVATPAVQTVHLKPGSPPEMRYSPGPKRTQYYKSTVSAPYHNAVQTETSNVMHFNESSESCHRTMSLQQTHKPEPGHPRRATSVPPPPTPSKFLPGEFRESDYESEVENVRIKPKWLPSGTQDDSLRYRRVRAPAASRSSSVPAPRDRVVKRSHSYEPAIHPGTPPEYGYIGNQKLTKSTATKIASQHMDSMTQAFKSKTQKFVKDIMGDVNKQQQKPILKSAADGDAQVYREESRAAQYGTKHVDPDTGLIYFKYDFGYEFGIVLPGESKQGEIPVPKKTVIEPPKRTVDIEMPVYHEKTQDTNHVQTPRFKPQKFTPSGGKPAKWEPTSESEMSEYEGEAKRRNNLMPGSRWEPSSCSPVSLSPSLPSTSPAFNNFYAGSGRKGAETPPSCPSTPGSTHGKIILQPGQARAPMFITPLRDIAVVSGQAAKFECIVQSEPPPNVLWSKNGRIIEYSNDYQLHYRNGVCRLTISQAYPEDAGTYTCTATNPVGTANTTATLQVPGERRSQYI